MAKKKRQPDDELLQAKHDIRKLVQDNRADRSQPQKNIPYNILMGMKKKQKIRSEKEEQSNREAQVLYNSFVYRKSANNPLKGGKPKLFSGSKKAAEQQTSAKEKKIEKRGKAFAFKDGILNVSKGMLRKMGGDSSH